MKSKVHSIGKEKAIELFNSNWWKGKSVMEIATFQSFTKELCLPFEIYHKAMEEVLGRPVWTHEFALNADGLRAELNGEKPPPTLEDIMGLIPEEKRIIVTV